MIAIRCYRLLIFRGLTNKFFQKLRKIIEISQVGIFSVVRFRITNRFRGHFIKDGNKYLLRLKKFLRDFLDVRLIYAMQLLQYLRYETEKIN